MITNKQDLMIIKLTPSEVILGATAGVLRQVENKKIGRKPAYGAGIYNDWQLNIEGVLGEIEIRLLPALYDRFDHSEANSVSGREISSSG